MKNKTLRALFSAVHSLAEEDLIDPRVEARARATLKELRKRGVRFGTYDQDGDCVCCLYMELLSAAEADESPKPGL